MPEEELGIQWLRQNKMVAEEFGKSGCKKRTWIRGYRRTWNKIVTEELRMVIDLRSKWLQKKLGAELLQKNLEQIGCHLF
jgi:hypothetical protein